MNILEIGKNIYKLRKGKKLTQEELSRVVGVSVAAVSKWEGGISYPDITLLPVIAEFFDVSIDDLMNYEHNISDEEVEKISFECIDLFEADEEKAMSFCTKYLRKYTKAYNLKFTFASLIIMQASKTKDKDDARVKYMKALNIFNDIINNCNDDEMVGLTIMMAGNIYTQIDDYDEALKFFEKIKTTSMDVNACIGNMYIKKGENEKGRKLLQKSLLTHILNAEGVITSLAGAYKENDIDKAKKYLELKKNIQKAREVKENYSDDIIELELLMEYGTFNEQVECFKKFLLSFENFLEETPMLIGGIELPWYVNEIAYKKKDSKMGRIQIKKMQMMCLESVLNDVKYEEILTRKDIMEIVDRIKKK